VVEFMAADREKSRVLMSLRKKIFAGLGVTGIAVSSLILVSGQANAAVPHCNAPSGKHCIKIINHTNNVSSWRESTSNKCLTGNAPGATTYWPNVWFDYWKDHTTLTAFAGKNCDGAQVTNWDGRWQDIDGDNYYYSTITNI
jgi:hypothetical protein